MSTQMLLELKRGLFMSKRMMLELTRGPVYIETNAVRAKPGDCLCRHK